MFKIYLLSFILITVVAVLFIEYQPDSSVITNDQSLDQIPELISSQTPPSKHLTQIKRERAITEKWRQQVEAFGFDPENIAKQEALNNTALDNFEPTESTLQKISIASDSLVNQLRQGEQRIRQEDLISINKKIEDQIRSIETVRLNLMKDLEQTDKYKAQFEQYAQIQLQRLNRLNYELKSQQK